MRGSQEETFVGVGLCLGLAGWRVLCVPRAGRLSVYPSVPAFSHPSVAPALPRAVPTALKPVGGGHREHGSHQEHSGHDPTSWRAGSDLRSGAGRGGDAERTSPSAPFTRPPSSGPTPTKLCGGGGAALFNVFIITMIFPKPLAR